MKKALLLLILMFGLGVEASAVTVFGVNTANELIRFKTTLPGTLELQVAISNLQPGENVLAIDFRPTNGQLYALGSTGRLYTLNLTTGAATLVALLSADSSDLTNPFAGLSGTEFGFDFNPVTDLIRVVSDSDQNLRINPDTGAVLTDASLVFAVGDVNVGENPAVTAVAYNNNVPGATTTSLVGIETFNDIQVFLNAPNEGTLTTAGQLFLGDMDPITSFDVPPGSSQGLLVQTSAANPSTSFIVNVFPGFCCTSPTATPNAVGGGSRVRSIAVMASSFFRFSAANFSVDEAAGVINIPIFRFGDTSTSAQVNIVTTDGTAIAPFDYTQSFSNSVFFNPGDTIRFATISIVNNPIPEPVETFTVSLANPSSNEPVTLGTPRTATVTITEGAPPPPSQPTPVTVFGVSLSNHLFSFRSNNTFTIDFSVAITGLQSGENVLNIDFRASNGLLYALGSTGRLYTLDTTTGAATLVGALTADPSDASDPFASLAGTEFGFDFNPVTDRIRIVSDTDINLDVNPDTATVITDAPLAYEINDPNTGRNPSIVGAAHTNPDNNPATGTTLYGVDVAFDMLVIQNPAENGTLNTVGPTNSNFTERFGFDIAADNTAYISSTPPGQSNIFSQINLNTGSVQFFGNNINFPDVVRDIAVSSSSFGTLQLRSNSFSVNEGDGVVEITVDRVGSTGTVSVNFSTSPLSASADVDYTTSSGTLTFGPGVTSQTFTVPIIDDSLDEFTEQFNVNLSNPTGGAVLAFPSSATVFIVDNDATALPSLSVNDVTVPEGNTGSIAVFTVTLSEARAFSVGVDFITSNGTATAGADYDSVSGFLTFLPGQTTRTVIVPINGDAAAEGDETFFVNLANSINANIADAQGQGTITDDEGVIATFAFSAPSFGDNEDCAVIPVTVNRTGVTSSAMSVNFATSNGTASDRRDYTLAVGTLEFAAGETSKTIPILISEDSFVEGIETLTVTLSNPSAGAGLGSQSSTTVLIIDDASEPATNPIDDAETFVCQHYHDFLNRDPDPAGLAFWTNEITSCGSDAACIDLKRQNVSAAFFLSIEFQHTGFLVERAYQAAFNRFPLYLEFIPDTQRIGRGVIIGQPGADAQLEANKQAFFNQFVTRPEFVSLFGGLTNAQYVDALNANTGGSLSDSERNALVTGLNNATLTRAQVLRSVAEDAEFTNREFNRAFVLMEYFGYLRRNPNDPPDNNFNGFNFWLNKLNQFNGNFISAEMVKAFISSIEYRQRFGQ